MGLGDFWLVLSTVQLVVAGYVLAAVLSWRGARFRPAPGHPFAPVPTALVAVAVGAVVVALVAVGDVEFARWMGTGGLMIVAIASLFVLLRQP
jgi:hypothetical protein